MAFNLLRIDRIVANLLLSCRGLAQPTSDTANCPQDVYFFRRVGIAMLVLCSLQAFSSANGVLAQQAEALLRVRIQANTAIQFATVEQGSERLRRVDRFLEALSRFDQECRLQTNEVTTAEQVGAHAAAEVRAWTAEEMATIAGHFESIRERLAPYSLPLPETIWLVKTTGREEGEAAYCRDNTIVLPQRMVDPRSTRLERTLVHELFHVLSNQNPALRRELYTLVGFHPCPPITLPESLIDRKITNPDAPTLDAYIRLELPGETVTAVPLLFASVDRFNPTEGGSFFKYLTFRLLVVEQVGDLWRAAEKDGQPRLLDPAKVDSFHAQIGKNTKYIIHPEEVLADNFVHLIFATPNLPTPDLIARLKTQLQGGVSKP